MFWPIIFVVVGLALTLAGMIITFRADPPHPKLPSIEEQAERQNAFIKALNEGNVKTPRITKTEWSLLGIRMLWGGTTLQLIGAVWQMVRLACRG